HVGEVVLERLVFANRLAKLLTNLCVFDGLIEQALAGADEHRGGSERSLCETARESVLRNRSRGSVRRQREQRAGLRHRLDSVASVCRRVAGTIDSEAEGSNVSVECV